jgi:microcin C transport system ATP-binding protein
MSLIEIVDLSVGFHTHRGDNLVVDHVSFSINKGACLALVGESGAGKSVSAHSILRLLPYPTAFHPSGKILYSGTDLLALPEPELQKIRGHRIAMIFQEPMTSLNPLHPIVKQVAEALQIHQGLDWHRARTRTLELFNLVQLSEGLERAQALPHELSGGQRQRVMIAMALANNPDLLIADEPTTALDVTIQAEILNLLKDLQGKLGMALLLITHDLGIVRKVADTAAIMTKGRIVEAGAVETIFARPSHEYTKTLLASEPGGAPLPSNQEPAELARVEHLSVRFTLKKNLLGQPVKTVTAVNDASLSIGAGQTLGLVGESGSGKTTLGLALLRLIKSEGTIVFMGQNIQGMKSRALRPRRREMQIVFQDPFGSLNPRLTIGQIVGEGLQAHGIGRDRTAREPLIREALSETGIDPGLIDRYPHEFSGGQRQRISVARALVLKPRLIVLDEPTSSLDLTVQAQIVELLRKIQSSHGLAYIFISHDLRVVRALSHRIAVMEKGRIVEQGPADDLFINPRELYTRNLIAASFLFSRQPLRPATA